jgi:hypothetical protein
MHEENGVTLEEIFAYYAAKGWGQVETWSIPETRSGDDETAIGRAILAEAKYTGAVE